MEEATVTVWHNRAPLLVYSTIAEKFGLRNGQQIEDVALHTQIMEENINRSRAACDWQPGMQSECTTCSS